jgi:magnesium transporter
MLGRHYDYAESIVVLDLHERVIGQISLSVLLELEPGAIIRSVMHTHMPLVFMDTDQERVASIALQHGLTAVPVVDSERKLCGVVPASALLGILRREHVEDIHRLAGIARESEMAREAIEAPPVRRVRHRLPWLLLGLAGSTAAALLMAQFEEILTRNISIAFFVPGIVYLADAIGTQTEAIAVRGLSLSHAGIMHLLAGELRTGLLLGAILGTLAFGGAWVATGDARLSAAVALSLMVASALASAIGLILPWLFARLGQDPAYGSGPLATIIQDVLTLAVYLSVAAAIIA